MTMNRLSIVFALLFCLTTAGCFAAMRQQRAEQEAETKAPPAPKPPPPIPAGHVGVPPGTKVMVRTVDPLSSKTHGGGSSFSAELDAPLTVGGQLVAPAGTKLYGEITDGVRGGKLKRAKLEGRISSIVLHDGTHPFLTNTAGAESGPQGTAAKVGMGAIIGGAFGGRSGAGKGAAVGAGVALIGPDKQVNVPPGTLIELDLVEWAVLPLSDQAPAASAPEPAPVTPAAPAPGAAPAPTATAPSGTTIPAGTTLMVRLEDDVDSGRHKVGSTFATKLDAPLAVSGTVVAPKGTTIYGRVTEAVKGGRLARRPKLVVELTEISLGDQRLPIRTNAAGAEGGPRGTVAKVGMGAIIGGAFGGKSGAAKGAAVGGGVALLTGGKQIRVPAGTLVEFELTQPVAVP